MKKTIKLFVVLLTISFATLSAQDENKYINEPGFVNFKTMSLFGEKDMISEVEIEEKLLHLVAKFTDKKEDPDLAKLLNGLKLIRVNTFKINPEKETRIKRQIKTIDKDLKNKKWDRIVKTRTKDDITNIYVKTVGSNEDFVGLTIVTMSDNKEVTFVNIVGSIDLETINKLGDKFDIPGLEDIKKEND